MVSCRAWRGTCRATSWLLGANRLGGGDAFATGGGQDAAIIDTLMGLYRICKFLVRELTGSMRPAECAVRCSSTGWTTSGALRPVGILCSGTPM